MKFRCGNRMELSGMEWFSRAADSRGDFGSLMHI